MPLSDRAAAWLRSFDPERPGDPGAAACALGLLARRTPAWTERYTALLGRLAGTAPGPAASLAGALAAVIDGGVAPAAAALDLPAAGTGEAWVLAAELADPAAWGAALSTPLPAGGRIVGVDTSRLLLRRAEWFRDGLLLTLDPHEPDPSARTELRLVGAEPRIWCQTGIDGATTDVTSHGVVVRTPLVRGDLEFTPGSY